MKKDNKPYKKQPQKQKNKAYKNIYKACKTYKTKYKKQ